MSNRPRLTEVQPTVFLAGSGGALRQVVRVGVGNAGAACEALVRVELLGVVAEATVRLAGGEEETHEVLVPEPRAAGEARVSLWIGGQEVDARPVAWEPPPHLRVHVVQRSHHDVGYTNLPSAVLPEHVRFLEEALDFVEATTGYPEEARFRLVIEQAWSLQEFARGASARRLEQMGQALRSGQFELTALFGNMTTELCGHEELVRLLYPSRRLARQFGCEIISAEHNDVPGLSWGVSQVLTEAGVRILCPGFPRYWSWCDPPLQTFWDEATLFPRGLPGCFWWEAPSGKRVLLWDLLGAGGGSRSDLPGLAESLQGLVAKGYPYNTVYWSVRGGDRDNSPYIQGFAETVKAWNEKWAYPRLVCSTTARFYSDLEGELGDDIPVFRGDLPGQDYPVGASSTARATGVNRVSHTRLPAAETLATVASAVCDHAYPEEDLRQAWEDVLWHDEHTWGHHFPCGPAALASQVEKELHAHRAAAIAHDVATWALARLADHVKLPGDGFYLVVFNPLPWERTATVSTPLREIENCGSVMMAVRDESDPSAPVSLRGVPLTDRWHVHPPQELVEGQFDLVDVASGDTVEFEITCLSDAGEPVPDAPERVGLSGGGKRYGFFEAPSGLGRDLRFVAAGLPAGGWRTYELRAWDSGAADAAPQRQARTATARGGELVIENEFYRVEAERESRRIVSVIDRMADCELLDRAAPHSLGELVVRSPEETLAATVVGKVEAVRSGLSQRLEFEASAPGHPQIRMAVDLQTGVRRVGLALRVLKDPTPLLDATLAFPFAMPEPRFRYESGLAALTPITDYLPEAYWDAVAVQNWLRVSGGGRSLLWNSREAAIVSLGGLQPGYVSPAHSCRVSERMKHPPAGPEQLTKGWFYSLLFAGNFGTNFSVSQCGSAVFRYSFATADGEVSDAAAGRWGWEATTAPETIFATRRRDGHLPLAASLLELKGDPVSLLACKRAEVGEGFVVRLWNPADGEAEVELVTAFAGTAAARLVGIAEDAEPVGLPEVATEGDTVKLTMGGGAVVTLRLGG